MALQHWGERDRSCTEAFLRILAGKPPFPRKPWIDVAAMACAIASLTVTVALLIAGLRATI